MGTPGWDIGREWVLGTTPRDPAFGVGYEPMPYPLTMTWTQSPTHLGNVRSTQGGTHETVTRANQGVRLVLA